MNGVQNSENERQIQVTNKYLKDTVRRQREALESKSGSKQMQMMAVRPAKLYEEDKSNIGYGSTMRKLLQFKTAKQSEKGSKSVQAQMLNSSKSSQRDC
ncbi:hypothetical protein AVEN_98077-1 [Araneus ventricosus]|uniref:Uncharacterized protein n=1 Tax=Araneus ventricosus TaxID=182803 RepID=A0A4Y2VCQ2_ARAVE|nr:hypothetical protein AVEN_98077-1 [Araneus ventricosus]